MLYFSNKAPKYNMDESKEKLKTIGSIIRIKEEDFVATYNKEPKDHWYGATFDDLYDKSLKLLQLLLVGKNKL